MYKRIFLIAGFFWLQITTLAQGTGYRYINFGLKDGLYDNLFYSAAQDKLGFIWIGSGSGLYKYDGIKFKKINSPVNKADNTISSFLMMVNKDPEGNLWLGSTSSLQWMNPATHEFWQPPLTPGNKAMMKAQLHYSFFGKYTWLASYKNYFYRFNPADSSFTSFASKYPAGASKFVYRVFELNNRVFALHENGVYCFTTEGDFVKFAPFINNGLSNGILLENENSLLLTSHNSGLYKFDLNAFMYSPVPDTDNALKKNILFSLYKKKDGELLIGGYGIFRFNLNTNAVTADVPGETTTENGLKVNKVASFLEDREHNIWVCSHFGLSMIPWQNSQITTTTILDPSTKSSTEIVKIYKNPAEDEYFITTQAANGLLLYKNGTVTSIPNKHAPGNSIKFLFYRKDGKIFATDYAKFYEFDYRSKVLSPVDINDQNGKVIFSPKYFAEGPEGILYMGSRENGFYKWEYISGRFTHYNLADIDKETADNHILPVYADSKNNIWFVSNNGVYILEANTGRYKHLVQSNKEVNSPMGKCLNLTEDANHHIWILTEGNGLFECVEKEKGNFDISHITSSKNKSLRGDGMWDIEKDTKSNMLWLSTVEGLARFNPDTKQLYGIFGMQHGMKEAGGGYSFEQSGNKLFQIFYSVVNIIDKETYRWNQFAPKPVITSLKSLQKEHIVKIDTGVVSVTLRPDENYFEIEFAGLCLNNSNANKYYYQLVGLDKSWQYYDDKNTVKYSGLGPGKYTFKIKYLNNDGVESPEQLVSITIKKPFYKTGWFIAAVLLAILFLFYAWNRYRIKNIKRETALKQQIAETEMKALRAQMNPHFIFNSLNSIQKYILKNDHFAASQYLTKFSRLIRLILDHSNQNTITLGSELDLLKLYIEMESLRFENKFEYTITVDAKLNTDTLLIPSMLVQPYVENAIWHGLLHKDEKGSLKLNFRLSGENELLVTIEDNGIGREKAAELKSKQVLKKKSYGMQITEDRITVINRTMNINARAEIIDLMDENNNATGTKVVLHIPLQHLTS